MSTLHRYHNHNESEEQNTKSKKNETETDDNDDILSTQNMIDDARARRHQKVKEFNCEMCEFRSGSEILRNRHKKAAHEEISYECNMCDHKTVSKTNLKMHMERTHEESQHPCRQCDHKATTNTKLKDHIKSIHEMQTKDRYENTTKKIKTTSKYISKRIQCTKCDKRFNKPETFKKHTEMQHGEI